MNIHVTEAEFSELLLSLNARRVDLLIRIEQAKGLYLWVLAGRLALALRENLRVASSLLNKEVRNDMESL